MPVHMPSDQIENKSMQMEPSSRMSEECRRWNEPEGEVHMSRKENDTQPGRWNREGPDMAMR
jgi:hypothetical protein